MKKLLRTMLLGGVPALAIVATGCDTTHKVEADTRHQVETVHRVEVAPIHVTVDVNVRIDRELDKAFAFEDDFR